MEDFTSNFLHVGFYKFAYESNTQKLSVWDEVQYIKKRVRGFDRGNQKIKARRGFGQVLFNFLDNLKTRHAPVGDILGATASYITFTMIVGSANSKIYQ